MKTLRAKSMIAAFSLILFATATLAQTSPTAPSTATAPSGHHFHGRRGFGDPMMGMFFHRLNLTDAQKAQFKQIMTQERPTLKPLMQQMRQGQEQLRTLEMSGSFDEAQARTIATQQSQTMTELTVQKARIESQMIQALTPDQKTQLAQMMQRHAQRFSNQTPSQDSTVNQ
jgi:protein CpxP